MMSLKWFKDIFKSEKEKELENLKIEVEIKKIKENVEPTQKPYRKLKIVNNVLTIVLQDGSVISKPNATEEDFKRARLTTTEEELLKIACDTDGLVDKSIQEKEFKKAKELVDGVKVLEGLSDFERVENTIYLKGTGRSLPPLLIEKFATIVNRVGTTPYAYDDGLVFSDILEEDAEYQALKRFFLWCCLNPRAEVADKLYNFLVENSFRITKQGFFVALRNVVTVQGTGDKELVKFVSNAYNKVKAVWKKKPSDYYVWGEDDGNLVFSKDSEPDGINKFHGNLQDLYLDLPNMQENRFTDDYTKTFDIRIGKVVNMPPEECSWSTRDCAEAGLHFTANQIHYVGCGDTSVLMLINPMKVVGIGTSKGRCYEYLPIMTVDREEATTILHDLDFDTLELDEDFVVRELENLVTKAKEGFSKEAKKYDFNLPVLSSIQLNNIVASLEDMKSAISKRIAVLD